jgi:digeranylgeranylglycerophospholipid reductase
VGALSLGERGEHRPVARPLRPSYDLVVVGAGPGGSMAAWRAASLGLSVLLIEKRQEIGSPVRCAEGVSLVALQGLVDPEEAWISARVSQSQIVARVGGKVTDRWRGGGGQGLVLERRVFDRALAERAVAAGAQVWVKATVTGLLWEGGAARGVEVDWHGRQMQVEAGVVIAADGVESRLGTWAGLNTTLAQRDALVCAQYLLGGLDWDPDCLGFWIDEEIAPGGYAWVFPKGEGRANVGLGVQADLAQATALNYLDRFVEGEPALKCGSPVTLVAGNVPTALPSRPLVANGLMLVGDAARQVDALTGGGIIAAMTAGCTAGRVAQEALASGDTSARGLLSYQVAIDSGLGRRLHRSYRLRERYPAGTRADPRFVRLFAVATGLQ